MTKHALVKKGIIENKPGNANCVRAERWRHRGTFYRIAKKMDCVKETARKAKEENDCDGRWRETRQQKISSRGIRERMHTREEKRVLNRKLLRAKTEGRW
jgi:hypothetical protein